MGDQVERDMSVMISNIRDFYDLSKRLTPEENFNFVNSFLKRFGPYIRSHDGLINKYLGAGIMALFPQNADQALDAAIGMRRELELYNVHRGNRNYVPVDIGIAINKGPLMLGIIGEEKRLESNVISDNVNLAVVLEKLSASLGVSILITDSALKAIPEPEKYQYRNLGMIQLQDNEEPVQLYDVYEGDSETIRTLKHKTKALFEQAIILYQVGRFYDARETFLQVIKQNRQDAVAKLYFFVCDEYFQKGTTEDWKGTLQVS